MPQDTDRLSDIETRADIAIVVRDFYTRAFADPLLGEIFVDIARMDLDAHLPVMCDFWETVLFRVGKYHSNAFHVHVALDRLVHLEPRHFDRWLQLWRETVDSRHRGPRAERAKLQGSRIARSMSRRLNRAPHTRPMTTERDLPVDA